MTREEAERLALALLEEVVHTADPGLRVALIALVADELAAGGAPPAAAAGFARTVGRDHAWRELVWRALEVAGLADGDYDLDT